MNYFLRGLRDGALVAAMILAIYENFAETTAACVLALLLTFVLQEREE